MGSPEPGSGPADAAALDALRRLLGHDLRSPLAVILGQCEVLGLEVYGPLNAKQRAALASIESQVERALALTDEAAQRLRGVVDGRGSAGGQSTD